MNKEGKWERFKEAWAFIGIVVLGVSVLIVAPYVLGEIVERSYGTTAGVTAMLVLYSLIVSVCYALFGRD